MDFDSVLTTGVTFIVLFVMARSMLPSAIVDVAVLVGGVGIVIYYIYNEGIWEKMNQSGEYEPARKE